MSFIYEYQLRNVKERQEWDLFEYEQVLENLIEQTFGRNLKETIIYNKSFEFRLYASVTSYKLQNLGKKIKKIIPSRHGFVRKTQNLYVIIDNIDEDTKMVSIEFIDSLVGDSELYSQRVNRFFKNDIKSEYSEDIKYNYYIDIYSADLSIKKFKQISGAKEVNVGDCYLIKANHRHGEEKIEIEDNPNIIKLDKIFDYPYFQLESEIRNDEVNDYFIINTFEKKTIDNGLKKIEEILNVLVEPVEEQFEIKLNSDKNVFFRVLNVGQALATSFSYGEDIPFLYFDYGIPFGLNAHTFITETNLPVDKNTRIIISHLDKDHWFGVSKFRDAYSCSWYIPDQKSFLFNHIIAGIKCAGGTVNLINKNITFGNLTISYAGISTYRATRPPRKRHETGLALCVDARDESNNNCKILIEADQDYDYVENAFLSDVNILVACHHGGKYSWTIKSDLPHPVIENNCIIYSYGDCNSHGHPNYVTQYQRLGWTIEHHTPIDGTFEKIIEI